MSAQINVVLRYNGLEQIAQRTLDRGMSALELRRCTDWGIITISFKDPLTEPRFRLMLELVLQKCTARDSSAIQSAAGGYQDP